MSIAKKICLVTSGHIASNPRIVKEADALAENGYDVRLIAVQSVESLLEFDAELAGRSAWRFSPIEATARQNPNLQRKAKVRYYLSRKLPSGLWPLGVGHRAAGPLTPELSQKASRCPADLFIAHNLAALPAAFVASRRNRAQLGFDAEDFHRGQFSQREKTNPSNRLCQWLENRYLPRCDYVTASSPGIARAYADSCAIEEPATILNVFPNRQAPESPRTPTVKPGPSLYWFSQTIGPGRGLENAIDALKVMRIKAHLYLRGTPAPGYMDRLKSRALNQSLADRVHFLPMAPPEEMLRLAADFSLGLALEQPVTENSQLCISNKLFTYLQAGLPIVATETPGQKRVSLDLKNVVAMVPPGEIHVLASLLDALLEDKTRLAKLRQAAWKLGRDRFNWDHEKKNFLDLVKRVLNPEKRPVSSTQLPSIQ